ncbi:MAG: hypothetical protein F6K16_32370 [Symploca sp. SIO2B6]|nr:hypothetical protein [Symploca sp. SIO2B6]
MPIQIEDDWRRADESGYPMSIQSRNLLIELWREESNNRHLRREAFSLWAITKDEADIEILRNTKSLDELADYILKQRIIRGGQQAVPEFRNKLTQDERGFWWHYGRYLDSLTLAQVR